MLQLLVTWHLATVTNVFTHPSLFLSRKPDFSVPYFLLPCGWWILYPLPEFFLFRYSWDTNRDLGLHIKGFAASPHFLQTTWQMMRILKQRESNLMVSNSSLTKYPPGLFWATQVLSLFCCSITEDSIYSVWTPVLLQKQSNVWTHRPTYLNEKLCPNYLLVLYTRFIMLHYE